MTDERSPNPFNENVPDWADTRRAVVPADETQVPDPAHASGDASDLSEEHDAPLIPELIQPEIIKPKKVRFSKSTAVQLAKGNFLPILAWAGSNSKSEEELADKIKDLTVSEHLAEIGKEINAAATIAFGKDTTTSEGVARILVAKAMAGDMNALREFMNRTEGKVPNRTITSGTVASVKGNASDFMALLDKIDKNK